MQGREPTGGRVRPLAAGAAAPFSSSLSLRSHALAISRSTPLSTPLQWGSDYRLVSGFLAASPLHFAGLIRERAFITSPPSRPLFVSDPHVFIPALLFF